MLCGQGREYMRGFLVYTPRQCGACGCPVQRGTLYSSIPGTTPYSGWIIYDGSRRSARGEIIVGPALESVPKVGQWEGVPPDR